MTKLTSSSLKIAVFLLLSINLLPNYTLAANNGNGNGNDNGQNNSEEIDLSEARKKEKLVAKVIDGTVMRTGVVYAKDAPLSAIDLARQFLREGRPAHASNEINELITGLKNGDKDAIANFKANMEQYLMDPNVGPRLIASLNEAIDNPNKYKLNKGFAEALLKDAFEKFITLDGDERPNTDFSRVDMDDMMISGLDLRKTGLTGSQLANFSDWTGTNVGGLNLTGVDFTSKTLGGTIFNQADLTDAIFQGKNLTSSSFKNAKLTGADFSNSTLSSGGSSGNFSGAVAHRGNFRGAYASQGNFKDADLSEAQLEDADFSGADFTGANLSKVSTNGNTKTDGAKYSEGAQPCTV